MTAQVGPTLRKRQLAGQLQRLRHEARVDSVQVQVELGCSRAKLTHLESARNLPSKPDLELMLRLYGRLDLLDELEALRVSAHQKSWFDTYRLPRWMQNYVGLETDAELVRCFALELVPGLLQTEDYARAALTRQGSSPDEAEREVLVRLERQRRIGGELSVVAVASEAVLHRTAHMTFGVEQLERLASAGESDAVEVRVIPFSVGGHRSMSGSFSLLDFPPGVCATVAYREGVRHGDLVDDATVVADLDQVFSDLCALACDAGDSVRLIMEAAERAKLDRSA